MESLPPIHYPPDLPVSERREDIAAAIRNNQVVIVAGETGSGKTTQLPKICLELGRTSIGHTQPRRLAARTIAERIASELGTELGTLVGYQVRFTDVVSEATRIKLMTDGILLNELHRDRLLRRYDTIIIDEAHERSLNVDFLLGYLKQLLPKRPDLKVIITSATIDPESFAAHFADAAGTPAPIVEVSGRTFPVDIRYRPLAPDAVVQDTPDDPDLVLQDMEQDSLDSRANSRKRTKDVLHYSSGGTARGSDVLHNGRERDVGEGILEALRELAREEPGDVLVFLAGEADIRDAADTIEGAGLPGTEVLPLYGRLSAADQHRVFDTKRAPGIRRRVVLATNVAETSLTVPGIKYVIDVGTARISRYSARSKIQRLPIEAISQASANQRSGRAGRTSDGIAIRLYGEDDFARRPEFTDPEILRTNLAAVILQMLALGLGDIREFPFLQPPDARGVKDGLDLLRELQAIDAEGRVTAIGRRLARLPVDPRFGRMILESGRHGVTREVMAIVAGLTIQDPRERPLEKRAQADQAHARFTDPTSDFVTLLNLWNHLRAKERELSGNAFRRLCRAEFLNYLRVREWGDVYRQLTRLASSVGLTVKPGRPDAGAAVDADLIHRSLLAGLLSQLGIRDDRATKAGARPGSGTKEPSTRQARRRGEYLGSRNTRFTVFPGSALAKKPPPEIMSSELVETSRLFARTNAAIDVRWAESVAGDLVKRQLSEPHWEKNRGSAVAFERVTLFGVPIVERRRVQLARSDPALARELFLRHALVEGEWRSDNLDKRLTAFDRANRALRRELEQVEERQRRRDILVDDEAVFDFYDARVPAAVTDVRGFEKWWRDESKASPDLLTMTRADLLDDDGAEPAAVRDEFPEHWRQGDQRFTLRYRFEPGAADDGVTVVIPLALLPRVQPHGFDWQVPGMRDELVTALIKTLPKSIRRNVVPAADWARRLLENAPDTPPEGQSLREFLAAEIRRQTHTPVDPDDFDLDRVPDHLRVTFAAVDERGKRLGASKDLAELQARLKSKARERVAEVHERTPHALERSGLTTWDFDALPSTLDTRVAGNTVRGYPALVDTGSAVDIRVLDTPHDQAREHRRGVLRLLTLTTPAPTDYVQHHLTTNEKLLLARSPYPSPAALLGDCVLAIADEVLGEAEVRTRSAFDDVRERLSASVIDSLFATVALVTRVLDAARTAEKAIKDASSITLMSPLADARAQLDALVHPGFVSRTGLAQLRRVPVYLDALNHRVAKLAEDPGRDRQRLTEVENATAKFRAAGGDLPLPADAPPALRRVRWMLEELRVSLFAQHLGTAEPVSPQRIAKALNSAE